MIYKFLRHMHLILGLLLFWVVMMYAVSAVQMAHTIRIVPVVTESDVMATPGLDARPLANELMEKNGISGEMGNVTPLPGGYRFALNRAGGPPKSPTTVRPGKRTCVHPIPASGES